MFQRRCCARLTAGAGPEAWDPSTAARVAAWRDRAPAICGSEGASASARGGSAPDCERALRFRSENGKGVGNFLHARFLEVRGAAGTPDRFRISFASGKLLMSAVLL